MTVGEYVSVFVSILLGLAVADLCFSLHRLLTAPGPIRWDWLSPAIASYTAINIVAFWWASYHFYQHAAELDLLAFLADFALLVLIFLAAAAALPDEIVEGPFDLRSFYFRRSRYFWSLNLLQLLTFMTFLAPRYFTAADLQSDIRGNLPNIIGVAVLAWTRNRWAHFILVPLLFAYLIFGYLGLRLMS